MFRCILSAIWDEIILPWVGHIFRSVVIPCRLQFCSQVSPPFHKQKRQNACKHIQVRMLLSCCTASEHPIVICAQSARERHTFTLSALSWFWVCRPKWFQNRIPMSFLVFVNRRTLRRVATPSRGASEIGREIRRVSCNRNDIFNVFEEADVFQIFNLEIFSAFSIIFSSIILFSCAIRSEIHPSICKFIPAFRAVRIALRTPNEFAQMLAHYEWSAFV